MLGVARKKIEDCVVQLCQYEKSLIQSNIMLNSNLLVLQPCEYFTIMCTILASIYM